MKQFKKFGFVALGCIALFLVISIYRLELLNKIKACIVFHLEVW